MAGATTLNRTPTVSNLFNHLAPVAREIARRCRTSSIKRKWHREFDAQATNVRQTLNVLEQATVGRAEAEAASAYIRTGAAEDGENSPARSSSRLPPPEPCGL